MQIGSFTRYFPRRVKRTLCCGAGKKIFVHPQGRAGYADSGRLLRPGPSMFNLGVILDSGSHVAAWRHPDVPADAASSFEHAVNLAQLAERGLFDMVFFADSLATRGMTDLATASLAEPFKHLEPMLLLAGIAAVTQHIGLVSTGTTTYYEPYHLARFFASLDHISKGRAGWNLVTSQNPNEAGNFGRPQHPPREDRYRRAPRIRPDGAGPVGQLGGRRLRLREGRRPLFRSRQGASDRASRRRVRRPRSAQRAARARKAGRSSPRRARRREGKALGAETADVIFTAQHDLATAVAFADDVKARLAAFRPRAIRTEGAAGHRPFRRRDLCRSQGQAGPSRRLDRAGRSVFRYCRR